MPVFEKAQAPSGSISLEMRDGTGAFVAGTPTVVVSRDGGAYAAYGGTLAAISGATGEWEYTPTATELGGGKLKVRAVLTGAVPMTREVLPEPSYTAARAGYLDALNGIVAAVWGYAGRTLTAVADSSGVATLLARLTAGRAANLDNLDAAVSSRSSYAGGDTAGTTTLLGRLSAPRASGLDNLDAAVSSRLATGGYTAPPTVAALASAVWGAATRTLSAFGFAVDLNRVSGGFDGVQPNAAFFANAPAGGAVQVVVSTPALVPGTTLAPGSLAPVRRGDSWSAQLTGLGTLTGRSKLWITAKRDVRRADADADFGIVEAGGLLTVAGAPPAAGQTGTIAVNDATAGAITATLSAAATAALAPGDLEFDVQALVGGQVRTVASGTVTVVADVTRAVG